MNIPGFTAAVSLAGQRARYQAEGNRGRGGDGDRVYMQKPNADNTAGGKCSATTKDGSVNNGTYDAKGWCCSPKYSNGSQTCINCDSPNNTCSDRAAGTRGGAGIFAGRWPGVFLSRS